MFALEKFTIPDDKQSVIDANQKVVADFHGGKTNALGFLVGQCMRQSKGQGNPAIIRELLEKALG